MIEHKLCDMRCLRQIPHIVRSTVDHSKPIESPGLPPGPGGRIREALRRLPGKDGTRSAIVVDHMVGTVIGPVMIAHSRIGMRNGNVVEGGIAAGSRRPEQQLQVHHVVDNDGIMPGPAVPGLDAAHHRIETRAQRTGAGEQDTVVRRRVQVKSAFPDQPKPVAETAIHHDTQVVYAFVSLFRLQQLQTGPRFMEQGGIMRKFVKVEERSAIKTACPPTGVAGFKTVPIDVPGLGKFAGRHPAHQHFVLIDALPEVGIDEAEQGRLGLQAFAPLGSGTYAGQRYQYEGSE